MNQYGNLMNKWQIEPVIRAGGQLVHEMAHLV